MQDFRKLKVWQRSHQLTLAVYRTTASFPKSELFGLTGQMRRSCSSIPTNIAEGCGRQGDQEFARFLQIALGSASELEYQLILARDLSYLKEHDYESLSDELVEVGRMLNVLIQRVRPADGKTASQRPRSPELAASS